MVKHFAQAKNKTLNISLLQDCDPGLKKVGNFYLFLQYFQFRPPNRGKNKC